MPSLPVLKKSLAIEPKQKPQYLRISNRQKDRRFNGSMLQRQALEAISNHKYLYIDFQSQNYVLQLQRKESEDFEQEDEIQALNNSKIGGMKKLQQINLSSYRMHRFLNEERDYLIKRKKWKKILGKQSFRDSLIEFNKIKDKVNPEKLQEYLQHKDIEHKWRKIQEREQKLYQYPHTDTTSRYQRSNFSLPSTQRSKPKQKFQTRLKLKAMKNLSLLLQN